MLFFINPILKLLLEFDITLSFLLLMLAFTFQFSIVGLEFQKSLLSFLVVLHLLLRVLSPNKVELFIEDAS